MVDGQLAGTWGDIGVVSFGGLTLGVVAFGGIAVGVWAFGGVVLGLLAAHGAMIHTVQSGPGSRLMIT